MANWFKKLFASANEREIARLMKRVDKILDLEPKYHAMSEEELRDQTRILKERLAKGETLDDILEDAYALVREATVRTQDKRLFPVQLLGGIVLHQGRIAEMKTGEGKTNTATLPAYLNALSGQGVHVVTVNDYLATFHSEWMGKIYQYLGLTVGLVVPGMTPAEKRQAYLCDITYGTNNEFGFDYLRDNMAVRKQDLVQRPRRIAKVLPQNKTSTLQDIKKGQRTEIDTLNGCILRLGRIQHSNANPRHYCRAYQRTGGCTLPETRTAMRR